MELEWAVSRRFDQPLCEVKADWVVRPNLPSLSKTFFDFDFFLGVEESNPYRDEIGANHFPVSMRTVLIRLHLSHFTLWSNMARFWMP